MSSGGLHHSHLPVCGVDNFVDPRANTSWRYGRDQVLPGSRLEQAAGVQGVGRCGHSDILQCRHGLGRPYHHGQLQQVSQQCLQVRGLIVKICLPVTSDPLNRMVAKYLFY